jgi:hypothetical protein
LCFFLFVIFVLKTQLQHPVRRKHQSTAQHAAITESVKQCVTSFAVCFPTISFALIESSRNTKLLVSKKVI